MGNLIKIFILQILFFLPFTQIIQAASYNIIKSIPGFPGILPFHFETGYVGVGENEEVQLFYYFVKSEKDPENDPLILWLTGGPGCSGLSGVILEVGPLIFNTSACNWHSKAPTYQLNPFSWTKVANIIFVDSPVGAGFSYATNPKGYYTDDLLSSRHVHQFLRKWLVDHDGFISNPLYVSGESYCGMTVPIIVQEIINGNKVGIQPILNLQGYILGNPTTWKEDSTKSRYDFAHRVSLLSDELYASTKASCYGTYKDVIMDGINCTQNLQAISNNLDPVYTNHVLQPRCVSNQTCQSSMYQLLSYWADDTQVRAVLHIQKGTKGPWVRCNYSTAYTKNVGSTIDYHQNFTQEHIRALIFSFFSMAVVTKT
ncbi:serine carboxypeptidase-like 10 isoform X2 [Chenopodium quinoa]|uniref:serine carboxypeptidase-like 10 isoform X2 n=1 Tax=Chenopodium quinoa TaxID=63459 RepID=UPI000B795A7F|nr:serine carboxypeptidase-like 10 isoform X2 [Chenopodium quinoa]